jgi:hypothetical protein
MIVNLAAFRFAATRSGALLHFHELCCHRVRDAIGGRQLKWRGRIRGGTPAKK